MEHQEHLTADEQARNAQAAAAGFCGLACGVIVVLWLAFVGMLRLCGCLADKPVYPDPVCETCGRVLDGSTHVCLPEGFMCGGAYAGVSGRGDP